MNKKYFYFVIFILLFIPLENTLWQIIGLSQILRTRGLISHMSFLTGFISQVFAQEIIEYEKTVSLGMSKNQVLATLGLPKVKRQFPDGTEVWVYLVNQSQDTSQQTYSLIFNPAGKVIEIILPEETKSSNLR